MRVDEKVCNSVAEWLCPSPSYSSPSHSHLGALDPQSPCPSSFLRPIPGARGSQHVFFLGKLYLSPWWATGALQSPLELPSRRKISIYIQHTGRDQIWFSKSLDLQALEKAQVWLLFNSQILVGCCNYL